MLGPTPSSTGERSPADFWPESLFHTHMREADIATLAVLAHGQDGVFHIDQALRLGIDRTTVRRSGNAGSIVRVHSNVWRFTAASGDRRQQIRAATMQVDSSVASHESSLCMNGVDHVEFAVVVSAGPMANQRHNGIRVHRVGDLHSDLVTTIDGIPTTTLPRAVVEAASAFRLSRLDALLDRVTITDRRTSIGAIERAMRRSNAHGRRGIGTLRQLLDDRAPSDATPHSIAEQLADELLLVSDVLPTPEREHPLPGWAPGNAFVDRAWPDAMLIVEIDSRTWHSREKDMAKDRERDRSAAKAGWQTLRILYSELRDEPIAAIADIEQTYLTRLAQLVA